MPQWGRPSGARHGKRRKGRDPYSKQKEDRRFEDLDSDTGDSEGVGLEGSFYSDELHFTGGDLTRRSRDRKKRDYGHTSESSEDEEDTDETTGATMQLALRTKEDLLVERALERIRRAQMLGKTNVKLSKRELDALERKRSKDDSKRKSSRLDLQLSDRRRSSGKSSPVLRERNSQRKGKITSTPHEDNQASPGLAVPPGIVVPGHDGPSYAPLGYYPPALSQNRRSGGASPRSRSQQELNPLPPQSRPRNQSHRPSSDAMFSKPSPGLATPPMSRRLPDDPNWLPRPRSASSNQPYPTDPYQQYSPPLQQVTHQLASNRRIVSGPPDLRYPEVQYLGTRRVSASNQPSAAISDPSLPRRERLVPQVPEQSESADDSGSSGSGVHVDVVPYSHGYGVNVGYEGPAPRQRRL